MDGAPPPPPETRSNNNIGDALKHTKIAAGA